MRSLVNRSRPVIGVAAAVFASLLVSLAGCGGGDDTGDSHRTFDPITCSATPSPCA